MKRYFYCLVLLFVVSASLSAADEMIHVVQKGDTVYGIARTYGVIVQNILDINGIKAPWSIKVGQRLRIPGTDFSTPPKDGSQIIPHRRILVDSIAAAPQEPANVNPEPINPFNFSASWPVKVKEAHNMTGKLSGIRLTAEKGEPVKSVTAGTVLYSGTYRGFGHAVFVRARDGYLYVYAGCESLRAKLGEKVSPGTELGYVGIDPLSEKPQLFFLVYHSGSPVDPAGAPRS